MQEPPIGAIYNGREHLRRLVEHYDFECAAGPLASCVDFQSLTHCFDLVAEWIKVSGPGQFLGEGEWRKVDDRHHGHCAAR